MPWLFYFKSIVMLYTLPKCLQTWLLLVFSSASSITRPIQNKCKQKLCKQCKIVGCAPINTELDLALLFLSHSQWTGRYWPFIHVVCLKGQSSTCSKRAWKHLWAQFLIFHKLVQVVVCRGCVSCIIYPWTHTRSDFVCRTVEPGYHQPLR